MTHHWYENVRLIGDLAMTCAMMLWTAIVLYRPQLFQKMLQPLFDIFHRQCSPGWARVYGLITALALARYPADLPFALLNQINGH